MKNLYKKLLMVVVLILGLLFGDMTRRIYFVENESIESIESIEVLTDTLPLENQGNIEIQLIENKKVVVISLEDLHYITKKRKMTKQTLKNLESLFKRLQG